MGHENSRPASANHVGLRCRFFLLLSGAIFLWPQHLAGQQQSEEAKHAEMSRKLFDGTHCSQSAPRSANAFSGCWKVGSIWGAPTNQNLKLGARFSADRAQLLLDSHHAQQVIDSDKPLYCAMEDVPTLEPYPGTDFSKSYTYVYLMLDMPKDQVGQIATAYYNFLQEKMPFEEYKRLVAEFASHGGKYIRTLINMGPTNVWWDGDAEEDFWALPASCDGYAKVEEQMKSGLGAVPGMILRKREEKSPPKPPEEQEIKKDERALP